MTSSPKTVTKKDIDDLVAKSQVKFTHYDNKLTHCVITLPCGFTITGESTCNNPADFNKEDGEKYALAKAASELWPLEYYRLAFEAYQASQNLSSDSYSDMPAETINAVIEAYGLVTDSLISISNPLSCCDSEQVITDIKKTESEWNSLTHSDDLSQMLEDEYPEAGKLVRGYFKSRVPFGEDIEDYASR